ncbi:MAG: hypothetical protein KGR68_18655 [Betaproteobacteria bacterium]|nr:hypothetical protein [Betaproteobacteria bacterium]
MDATNFLMLMRLRRALQNGDPQAISLYAYTALRSENQTVRTIARKMIQTSDVTYGSAA